jgi:hypothetical protein
MMMTGEAHRTAILKILDRLPDARTKRFFADLRIALREEGDPEWDTSDDLRVVPDAFLIDRREKSVIVFEVEASNPVDHAKIANYCELHWALDDWDWRLGLITIDRWGTVTSIVDMQEVALNQISWKRLDSSIVPPSERSLKRAFLWSDFESLIHTSMR